MIKTKKQLGIVIGSLLAGINAIAHSDVPVRIFNQNIQAQVLCNDTNKKNMLENFIRNNKFDFILTQEYEGICSGLFEKIKNMGYSIATDVPGDSTLFYKNDVWSRQGESKVNTTFNTPDGWGHDGTRQAVLGVYQKIGTNPNLILSIGTAHLCVIYPAPAPDGSNYSKCVINNETEAHKADFDIMVNAIESSPTSNWILAGDMNAGRNVKTPLIDKIKGYQSTNINELNNQDFDMAFYKGQNIINMIYSNTAKDLPNISDHVGFVLNFTLKE
jgi:hypothetical protein